MFARYRFHPSYVSDEYRNALVARQRESGNVDLLIILNGSNDTHLGINFMRMEDVTIGSEYSQAKLSGEIPPDFGEFIDNIEALTNRVATLEIVKDEQATEISQLSSRLSALENASA